MGSMLALRQNELCDSVLSKEGFVQVLRRLGKLAAGCRALGLPV